MSDSFDEIKYIDDLIEHIERVCLTESLPAQHQDALNEAFKAIVELACYDVTAKLRFQMSGNIISEIILDIPEDIKYDLSGREPNSIYVDILDNLAALYPESANEDKDAVEEFSKRLEHLVSLTDFSSHVWLGWEFYDGIKVELDFGNFIDEMRIKADIERDL